MKAAIIDDEEHCIESLAIHINELFPDMEITYQTNKVQEALEKLHQIQIDLLFLDVEMPGMNGFQLLEHHPDRTFDVIFITGYSEYALRAFKSKALNYLLKPIDGDELKDVVGNWAQKRATGKTVQPQNIDDALRYLKKRESMKSKISVPVSDGYDFIEINTIMYCYGRGDYTDLFLTGGTKLVVGKPLEKMGKLLINFFFIRVHQSYLINPNYVKTFSIKDGGSLTLNNRKVIPIGRSRYDLVLNLFEPVRN